VDPIIALRGAQTALMAFAFGLLWTTSTPPFNTPKLSAHRFVAWLISFALCCALLRLGYTAWTLQDLSNEPFSLGLMVQTHVGQIVLAQVVCLLLALTSLMWLRNHKLSVCVLLLAMLGSALTGHVAAAAESWVQLLVSSLHVLLAQLWLSGVIGLWWRAKTSDAATNTWRLTLARFSIWALPGMLLILASGVSLANDTVASWAGLVATPYGLLLVLKLMMVAGALVCAWQLRTWLRGSQTSDAQARTWLTSELGLALAVLLMASWLASTIPAAHDTIVWPFSFRWAPVLAWQQDPTGTAQQLAWGAAAGVVGLMLWLLGRHTFRLLARVALCTGVLAALVVTLPATSITAYPTTYMHSSARLDVVSVTAGHALYEQHCQSCHGLHGHGDGPLAILNHMKPANLTEPHVNWHTHGDMFWWLSHGKGLMPGFADVLTVDERWHLINWLVAQSLGHEARSLTNTPAPFNPWLPSIDFRFQMDTTNFMSLSEWRGLHAVHLVFVNQKNELQRVRDLLQDMKGFPAQLVIVSRPEWLKDLVKGPCEAILVGDSEGVIAQAWSNYRRSFAAPDLFNEEPRVPRMEFLIDRYGFVRARWRSDESPSALSINELKQIYDTLSLEGKIKSAAIHQHD